MSGSETKHYFETLILGIIVLAKKLKNFFRSRIMVLEILYNMLFYYVIFRSWIIDFVDL